MIRGLGADFAGPVTFAVAPTASEVRRDKRRSALLDFSRRAGRARWRRAPAQLVRDAREHGVARPTGFTVSDSRGAMRLGRSKACAMKPCRSLPPPMTVRASYGRKHWSRASRLRQ